MRAVALIGVVVMNYHGYLIFRGADDGDGAVDQFFDPQAGPLATRFAATFVLVAGVGVTLITRSSIGDRGAMSEVRWRLVRRGLLLYLVGIGFDMIWNGTILPFYGAMFALAGLFVTWRSRWILLVGITAALAGAAIHWWRTQRALDGDSTAVVSDGSRITTCGDARHLRQRHAPAVPVVGVLLHRHRARTAAADLVVADRRPRRWFPAVHLGVADLVAVAADAAYGGLRATLASTDPFDRGLLYTASALGTALLAFGLVSWMAEQFSHARARSAHCRSPGR